MAEKKDEKKKPVSPKALQAAMLEGTGHSLAEITKTLDVSESTVSRWRRREEYRAEVDKFKNGHVEALEPVIRQVKQHLADGAIEAVDELREQLKATVIAVESDAGVAKITNVPDWETRHQAAATLLAHFKVAANLGADPGDGGGAVAGQVNIVIGADAMEGAAVRPEPRLPDVEAEATRTS